MIGNIYIRTKSKTILTDTFPSFLMCPPINNTTDIFSEFAVKLNLIACYSLVFVFWSVFPILYAIDLLYLVYGMLLGVHSSM